MKACQGVREVEIFEKLFYPRLIKEIMPEKIPWRIWHFTKVEKRYLEKKQRKSLLMERASFGRILETS